VADFVDKLSQLLQAQGASLGAELRQKNSPTDLDLGAFVRDHWLDLPEARPEALRPAYAIDGSMRQVDLDSGSVLIIAQSLCIGSGGFEEASIDLQILPPTTPRPTAARFADLAQRLRELRLAADVVTHKLPQGSLLYLDGALYGLLPQLFPSPEDERELLGYPGLVLQAYLDLLDQARARKIDILAIAKTSREARHARIWLKALPDHAQREIPSELSDASLLHRWTAGMAGFSEPVVLGTDGFSGGSAALLDDPRVAGSPAIASFFLRLAPWDDCLRVDLPAHQAGCALSLKALEGGSLLPAGTEALHPTVQLLAQDYGGPEVYNALLYSVDREVRLRRQTLTEVYLPLIGQALGSELRPDRSTRRFL
jgi:hypothetical protein